MVNGRKDKMLRVTIVEITWHDRSSTVTFLGRLSTGSGVGGE